MSRIQPPPIAFDFDELPHTETDPAHFVVRNPEYPQIRFYPYICAAITDQLLARDRARTPGEREFTAPEVIEFVMEAIAANARYFTTDREEQLRFGHLQPRGTRDTTNAGNAKYGPPVHELQQRVSPDADPDKRWRHQITVPRHYSRPPEDGSGEDRPDAVEPVRLTSFEYNPRIEGRRRTRIIHPPGREDEIIQLFDSENGPVASPPEGELPPGPRVRLNDEHIWNHVCQSFHETLGMENGSREALDAALRCYGYVSHDKTGRRGQASLAGIVLQYLAQKKEVTVPFVKAPIDYHMQALCRTPEDFVRDFPQFVDPDAASAGILEWQAEEARRQFREADLGQRIMAMTNMMCRMITDGGWEGSPDMQTKTVQVNERDLFLFTGMLREHFFIDAQEVARSGDQVTFRLSIPNERFSDSVTLAMNTIRELGQQDQEQQEGTASGPPSL